MISQDSLDAGSAPGAKRTLCSWEAGWRGVLLREFKDPLVAEDYTCKPTGDQKLVLLKAGSSDIERHEPTGWHSSFYRPGHLGLLPPWKERRLRWRGTQRHHSLQLFLPGAMIEGVAGELFGPPSRRPGSLQAHAMIDPVVSCTMLALDRAARSGAPDLYAESAGLFLASHLMLRQSRIDAKSAPPIAATALRRVTDYMHAHLSEPISLDKLARVADVERFQLMRMTKRAWGETPIRRLTRLRMELAGRLLLSDRLTVIEIALECGYAHPAHFATAFRRWTGRSPTAFRRGV